MRHEVKRAITFPAVTILGLCFGLASCGGSSEAKSSTPAAAGGDPAPGVTAVKVARENLSNDIVLTAEFIPYQEIDVMAKVAGYIKTIRVDIGDRVREGDPIATLEVPEMQDELNKAASSIQAAEAEIATANDEIERAGSAHQIAHLSWSRIEDVSKKEAGLVPQQEVDEAHSRDLQAEAQVAGAKSRLREAEQKADVARGEQSRLKTMFKYTAITAPFDGVVTKRYANAGSMIQAGTSSQTQAMPVVRLSQNNLLRLIVPVPESAVPGIHTGGFVDVNVPVLHRTFHGRVTRFADKIQMSTRTMETEIDVPNPDLVLVPGMYAEVDLRIEERNNTLAVPLDAVDGADAAARAWTIDAGGVIRIVPVTIGIQTPRRVEIRSGLAAGDEVIVGRHAGLQDGQKVQPRIVNPDQE
jgi:RND family efflux transporter MFP subunit